MSSSATSPVSAHLPEPQPLTGAAIDRIYASLSVPGKVLSTKLGRHPHPTLDASHIHSDRFVVESVLDRTAALVLRGRWGEGGDVLVLKISYDVGRLRNEYDNAVKLAGLPEKAPGLDTPAGTSKAGADAAEKASIGYEGWRRRGVTLPKSLVDVSFDPGVDTELSGTVSSLGALVLPLLYPLANNLSHRTLSDLSAIITSWCRAVQALHDAGVLHLDLKPANVLLTAKNGQEITLIDLDSVLIISEDKDLDTLTPQLSSVNQVKAYLTWLLKDANREGDAMGMCLKGGSGGALLKGEKVTFEDDWFTFGMSLLLIIFWISHPGNSTPAFFPDAKQFRGLVGKIRDRTITDNAALSSVRNGITKILMAIRDFRKPSDVLAHNLNAVPLVAALKLEPLLQLCIHRVVKEEAAAFTKKMPIYLSAMDDAVAATAGAAKTPLSELLARGLPSLPPMPSSSSTTPAAGLLPTPVAPVPSGPNPSTSSPPRPITPIPTVAPTSAPTTPRSLAANLSNIRLGQSKSSRGVGIASVFQGSPRSSPSRAKPYQATPADPLRVTLSIIKGTIRPNKAEDQIAAALSVMYSCADWRCNFEGSSDRKAAEEHVRECAAED